MSRDRFGLMITSLIAAMDLAALLLELVSSLFHSFEMHLSLGEALFRHFRYFTILTNWGIVSLLVVTILTRIGGRRGPHPSLYGGALIYILVVCVTYEILLRNLLAPRGLFFFSDLALHDIVPMAYLAFWLGFAPKRGLRWHHAFAWLAVPAAYLAMTLVAGLRGNGYPYDFLDVDKIGYRGVTQSALLFLLAFWLLGLGTILLSRVLPDSASRKGAPVTDDRSAGG